MRDNNCNPLIGETKADLKQKTTVRPKKTNVTDLGSMGCGIAKNLIKAGNDILV